MFLNLVFKSFQIISQLFSQTELIYLLGFAIFVFVSTLFFKFFVFGDE